MKKLITLLLGSTLSRSKNRENQLKNILYKPIDS